MFDIQRFNISFNRMKHTYIRDRNFIINYNLKRKKIINTIFSRMI